MRVHAHHDDYARPLDVRWLCSRCHVEWHRENGPGLNQELQEDAHREVSAARRRGKISRPGPCEVCDVRLQDSDGSGPTVRHRSGPLHEAAVWIAQAFWDSRK